MGTFEGKSRCLAGAWWGRLAGMPTFIHTLSPRYRNRRIALVVASSFCLMGALFVLAGEHYAWTPVLVVGGVALRLAAHLLPDRWIGGDRG